LSFSGAAAGSAAPAARERLNDDEFNSSDEENEAAPDKMEVDNDHDPWDNTGTGVAMDTSSSPWDTPSAGNSSTTATATGWADFDAFSSSAASDSASSDIIEKQQSEVMNVEDKPEDENSDSWRPSMASSPEATMLDCSQDSLPDVTTGNDSTESDDDNEKQFEERLKDEKSDQSESKQNAEKEESLEENFAFLSNRGMIAKDNVSNSTESQKQDDSKEAGDKPS